MEFQKVDGKSKGTIVFIHGNSSSSKVYEDVINSDLITQTKIAVDLPGHGSSAQVYDNEEDFYMQSYCKVLLKLIASIDDDILLVGNSLGGHIAIEISEDIKRLKGLVIFGTPPVKKPLNLEDAFLPVVAFQTYFTEHPTDIDIQSASETTLYNKGKAIKVYKDFKLTNPKVRRAVGLDVAQGRLADEYSIFMRLKVPKFIIAGEQDPSVNLNYLKQINKACKANCELKMIKNCGHYPSLDQPEAFNIIIKNITDKVFN